MRMYRSEVYVRALVHEPFRPNNLFDEDPSLGCSLFYKIDRWLNAPKVVNLMLCTCINLILFTLHSIDHSVHSTGQVGGSDEQNAFGDVWSYCTISRRWSQPKLTCACRCLPAQPKCMETQRKQPPHGAVQAKNVLIFRGIDYSSPLSRCPRFRATLRLGAGKTARRASTARILYARTLFRITAAGVR